jgi:hypothetical protein
MAIEQWHWGKLVILWAWGGMLAALLLTLFVLEPVENSPARSALSLALTIALLLALSAITWRWLGGKERRK